jgi:hypothetical protein
MPLFQLTSAQVADLMVSHRAGAGFPPLGVRGSSLCRYAITSAILIRIEPELRRGRVTRDYAFGQAPAPTFDREVAMQRAEWGRNGQRALADLIDGVILSSQHCPAGYVSATFNCASCS